jgi:hypothetical protein
MSARAAVGGRIVEIFINAAPLRAREASERAEFCSALYVHQCNLVAFNLLLDRAPTRPFQAISFYIKRY